MLRIFQNSSPAGAKSYYSKSADYYSEGQELVGVWRGRGAERLGLSGEIQQKDWDALCENRNPETGKSLTPRQRGLRRVGYDFNFHVPKSVSLYHALTGDERVMEAFRESVAGTMDALEAEMQTRVRAGGKDEDRTTGNMIWGEYVHLTARPVDGVPDPHLHAHCFVFNGTWDSNESRWKAGQFSGVKRDAPFFEAVFHATLAKKLADHGLPIERTRGGWEIGGIAPEALRKFSRRTALIEAQARAKGLLTAAEKDQLGARTRENKSRQFTMAELRETWDARLTPEERDAVRSAANKQTARQPESLTAAVDLALDHCFERSAVVPERTMQAEALKRAFGSSDVASVLKEIESRELVNGQRNGRKHVTTREVLAEEQKMLAFAREGRGTCAPLARGEHEFQRDWLNDGQRAAVRHVLSSPDRVMLIRGAAGVGKTTMMKEAVDAIEANGKRVFTFAPSADASRGVLQTEGFEGADTVARLLVDPQLQAQARGQVLWIDEAGLLGSRAMGRLFDVADRLDARVILSGDRKQHGSVERGAALRLLETEAGVRPAEIKEIQRQSGEYKRAVQALSDGRVADGFRMLDGLRWIREVGNEERYGVLAADYVGTIREGKTALVVSPTHREGEWITSEIRTSLQNDGRLGRDERPVTVLENTQLTQAERADRVNYESGDVLIYHQNAKSARSGDRVIAGPGPLPLKDAGRFQVYRAKQIALAPGEVIRVTRNGKTADGLHRLDNGALFTVKNVMKNGDIELAGSVSANGRSKALHGWTISKSFGHLDYGYVVTSHASQGKTVDRVFIGQAAFSAGAASREQFYVSVSRGREQAVIYTDDKAELLAAVSEAEDRPTATEFVDRRRIRERVAALLPVLNRPPEPERAATDRTRANERGRELEYER